MASIGNHFGIRLLFLGLPIQGWCLVLLGLVVSLQSRVLGATGAVDRQDQVLAAQALIARVAPQMDGKIRCELISQDEGKDVFEYETVGGALVLRGNDTGALAVAFNQYLRRELHADYSWLATSPLSLPGLVLPAEKVRGVCAAQERFFLNYCTYGYTFPWWHWDQWERFVDWMALNGVNRPLLQAGQEAIWYEVWKSYGLSDEEILNYFSAPAHLPWHRMANLDSWGGPLPMSYLKGQSDLQVRIVKRARELGMKPILSAFAGHVPKALMRLKPEAHITPIKPGWSGMTAEYATSFLDPYDPLFSEIQGRFLAAQERLFGTDHLYAADPFNEINPPSWEPSYLAGVSRSIYSGMSHQDPDAVWYQMTWTFSFFKLDHAWTKERLVQMFDAVPRGRMVLLDYAGEEKEFYPDTENAYGLPFLWNYLGNFGGNSHLEAPLKKVASLSRKALAVPNCLGVGSTLEGLGMNPVIYDFLLENPWKASEPVEAWVASYAKQRAGKSDESVEKAWALLVEKILVDNHRRTGTFGSVFQGMPQIAAWKGRKQNSRGNYELADLETAISLLLQADPSVYSSDGYRYDLVNFTRQALCDRARDLRDAMMASLERGDRESFSKNAGLFLSIGRDLDRLLATRQEFLLGAWIRDARSWGTSEAEKAYYEHNAREILTSWHTPGGELTDYASRLWSGLVSGYYLPRWERWVELQRETLQKHEPFPEKAYLDWVNQECRKWNESHDSALPVSPVGDSVELSRELFDRYLRHP